MNISSKRELLIKESRVIIILIRTLIKVLIINLEKKSLYIFKNRFLRDISII